ncbi:protein jim lovell [Drosophila willistoni]|nr:protein jim lovell [Drosophila willistoni]
MNNLKWMGHSATIMDIQRSLQNDDESCEVVLAAKDGASVRAHLFILSTCSDLMRNLLVDVPPGQETTIILPDIRGDLLESMLSFIYVGETSLPSASLTEFVEAINLLGIKSAISFECNPTSLNSTNVDTVAEGSMAVQTAKSIGDLQIEHAELLDEEDESGHQEHGSGDTGGNTLLTDAQQQQPAQSSRSLEYLDVYGDQPKITYSIEHMSGTSSGNQYILTENTGTFTISQSAVSISKLDTSNVDMADDDAETDCKDEVEEQETQLIEEEYAPSDPLIGLTMGTDADMGEADGEDDDEGEDDDGDVEDVMEMEVKPQPTKSKSRRVTAPKAKRPTAKPPIKYTALKNDGKDGITDALELAADAVLRLGLSLQKAADRYDISKTVLWRRVRHSPEYMRSNREKPSLAEAYERLKNGDSLKNISHDLSIPMSTLHRHKMRLAAQGRLPDFVACRRRDTTPKDELRDKLAKALHACTHEGMSQNHAANLFEIPKSTLWRHLQRHTAEKERKVKMEQNDDDDDEDLLT